MRPSRLVNLKTYYSNFKSLYGVLTAFAAVLPFIPKLAPGSSTEYLLAPLGDIDNFVRSSFAVFCVAVTYFVHFFFQDQSHTGRKRAILFSLLIIPAFSLVLYIVFCLSFVRRVDIPALGHSVFVSVGYQRSEFAKQNFGSMTDEEMLRQRGLGEEEVRKLWTQFSLVAVRVGLILSWYAFALSLVLGLSLGVLDQAERASAAPHKPPQGSGRKSR